MQPRIQSDRPLFAHLGSYNLGGQLSVSPTVSRPHTLKEMILLILLILLIFLTDNLPSR